MSSPCTREPYPTDCGCKTCLTVQVAVAEFLMHICRNRHLPPGNVLIGALRMVADFAAFHVEDDREGAAVLGMTELLVRRFAHARATALAIEAEGATQQ